MSDLSAAARTDLLKEFLYGPPNVTVAYLVAAIFAVAHQSDDPKKHFRFALAQLESMILVVERDEA